jgi:lipid A 3-O-deacylase
VITPVRRLRHLLGALFVIATVHPTVAPGAQFLAESRPWDDQAITVESGMLWNVGNNTPLSYRLVPTQISWRSPEVISRQYTATRLVIRHRVTLFGTWFQQGPESHYFAAAASPSIEWWNNAGTWNAYAGAGGGLGWLDAQDVIGAQGQSFTFNWFARAGVEHVSPRGIRWNAGAMFQHLSNGGQTNPNPGIDAVGFMIGWAWSF